MWPSKPEVLISPAVCTVLRALCTATSMANLGFSTTPSAMKLTPGDCNNDRQHTGNCNGPLMDVLLANLAISGSRSLSQLFG